MDRRLFITLLFVAMFLFLNKALAITCDYYIDPYSTEPYNITHSGVYCFGGDLGRDIYIKNCANCNIVIDGLGHKLVHHRIKMDNVVNSSVTFQNIIFYNHSYISLWSGNQNNTITIKDSKFVDELIECLLCGVNQMQKEINIINVELDNAIDFHLCALNSYVENLHGYAEKPPWSEALLYPLGGNLTIVNLYVNLNGNKFMDEFADANLLIIKNSTIINASGVVRGVIRKITNSKILNSTCQFIGGNLTIVDSVIEVNNFNVIYLEINNSIIRATKEYSYITKQGKIINSNLTIWGISTSIGKLYIINSTINVTGDYGIKLNEPGEVGYIVINNSAIYGGKYGIELYSWRSISLYVYNSKICYQQNYSIKFDTGNTHAVILNSYFDYVNNVNQILGYPDNNYWCNGIPKNKTNKLIIHGYFDLSQNTTYEVNASTVTIFDKSQVPFYFVFDKAVFNISKVIIQPQKLILNNDTNLQNRYEYNVLLYTENADGSYSVSYTKGISLNYRYYVNPAFWGTSYVVFVSSFYVPKIKSVDLSAHITIRLKIFGLEKINFWKILTSQNRRYVIPFINIWIYNTETETWTEYFIIPTYNSLHPALQQAIDKYLDYYKKLGHPVVPVKLSYPTSILYDFLIDINKLVGSNSSKLKLDRIYIGILSPVAVSGFNYVFSKSLKVKLNKTEIEKAKTESWITKYQVNGSFAVSYLEIKAETSGKEITQPPFPLKVNGIPANNNTIIIDNNIDKITLSSDYNVKVIGSLKIYGLLVIPFNKIGNYTYSAYFRYNYTIPFNLDNVTLFAIPGKPTKIIKQEYYVKDGEITWIKLWNNSMYVTDITDYFICIGTGTYNCYLKEEKYAIFFDPTNGAKLQASTRWGDEVYNITYYLKNLTDVWVSNVAVRYENNTAKVIINITANYNATFNVSYNLTCDNGITITGSSSSSTIIIPVNLTTIINYTRCKLIINITADDENKANNFVTVPIILTNQNIPEVGIVYAEIVYSEGENNAMYPVFIYLYSSIPQNITIQVDLQKLINGNWVTIKTQTRNVSFVDKRYKTIFVPFEISNSVYDKYRAIVKIINYQNDTYPDNNEFITNTVLIHISVDSDIYIYAPVSVIPGKKFNITLITGGNLNIIDNNVSLEIKYYDVLTKTTKTIKYYYQLRTGENKTVEITTPYSPYVELIAKITPINFSDRNPQNNQYYVKVRVLPDVRIYNVEYKKYVKSGEKVKITLQLLSNTDATITVFVGSGENIQTFTVYPKIGLTNVTIYYKVPELKMFELERKVTIPLNISGDFNEYGNNAELEVIVYGTYVPLLIFIVLLIIIIIVFAKILPRLVSKHVLKDYEFEYVRRKR